MKNNTEIDYLQAALFTRIVQIGETNPSGEASFKGYERVPFFAFNGTNIDAIDFPESEDDCPQLIKCFAALDWNNKVVGAQVL